MIVKKFYNCYMAAVVNIIKYASTWYEKNGYQILRALKHALK